MSSADLRLQKHGAIGETYPLGLAANTTTMSSQAIYFGLVGVKKGSVVTGINVAVSTQGTASTSVFVALYDGASNLLASSGDLTTALDSVGVKALAFTTPYVVPADDGVYAAIMTISGGPAVLLRAATATQSMQAINTGVKGFGIQTGQATLPNPATIAAGTTTIWFGVYGTAAV